MPTPERRVNDIFVGMTALACPRLEDATIVQDSDQDGCDDASASLTTSGRAGPRVRLRRISVDASFA